MDRLPSVKVLMSAAICLASVGVWAAAAPAPSYQVMDLGTLGGERTSAMGINNRGDVVGFSDTSKGLTRAFLYSGGSLIDLGTLGGDESLAYRISDKYNDLIRRKDIDVYKWAAETGREIVDVG